MDPAFARSILDLGVAGVVLIGFYMLLVGRLRTDREFKENDAKHEQRYADMKEQRDDWRGVARSYGGKVDQLTDAVEALAGPKP